MKSVAVARVAGPGPELPPKAGHGDRRSADRACLWLAAALALAAVAHRLWLAASQFILTTDTGTLALMALNILKGERPLFLYGFSYSGAPLAYSTR